MDYRFGTNYTPTREQLDRWRDRLSSEENAIDWLWRLVAPHVSQRQRARTCVLLCLASPLDRNGFRGRSHVLLYDDAVGGTGKSEIGDWVKRTVPDAMGVGPSSSGVGLKYNANTGKPGKLTLAHEGTLRIEELDKFDKGDRDAMYESMSDGYFEVDKGDVAREFPAETRIIALSNEPGKLADPHLTRFDYTVEMDTYTNQETITVAHDLQDHWQQAFLNDVDTSPAVDPLVAYLNWCSTHDPSLSSDVDERIREGVEHLIGSADLTGEIRNKVGYLRTTYTIARLNRRDIQFGDWLRAVDFIEADIDVAAVFDHTDEIPE